MLEPRIHAATEPQLKPRRVDSRRVIAPSEATTCTAATGRACQHQVALSWSSGDGDSEGGGQAGAAAKHTRAAAEGGPSERVRADVAPAEVAGEAEYAVQMQSKQRVG